MIVVRQPIDLTSKKKRILMGRMAKVISGRFDRVGIDEMLTISHGLHPSDICKCDFSAYEHDPT